jgi:hypothetical protein
MVAHGTDAGFRTIASALGELGKDRDFGDLATRGRAEKAVLDLLASAYRLRSLPPLASSRQSDSETLTS